MPCASSGWLLDVCTVAPNICGSSVTCFMSPFWSLEFWGGSQRFLENLCTPAYDPGCAR